MSISTIFANVSCSNLDTSIRWYGRLFGKPPTRRPIPRLAEWHLTDSAEFQLYEAKEHAGHSTLTLRVLPLEPERTRLLTAGLACGPIEQAEHVYLMRMRDPDKNLVVLASARRS